VNVGCRYSNSVGPRSTFHALLFFSLQKQMPLEIRVHVCSALGVARTDGV